jgi:hypothetical protein
MWRNWVGNQSCEPARTASPESEDEVTLDPDGVFLNAHLQPLFGLQ